MTHAPLANHVAVVTGASSGIGQAIARALEAHGATLCGLGRHMSTFAVDLNDETQIRDVASAVQKHFGGVDILVHSAGVFAHDNANPADFEVQHRVNVRAPCVLTQAFLPSLRLRRGQIVLINSSVARHTHARASRYATTKIALKDFADGLRNEVNQDGVRVLSVFVGRTATPMQASIHEIEGKEYRPERLLHPEDVASVVVNALCLPRTAEVTEIDIRPMLKPDTT
jgi:NADP-dependent 3-hydroxy acid dehydrogenase YdfG